MEKLYKSRNKPEKTAFHKLFLNLKSFIFVGYKKLHKIPIFNSLRKDNKHKRRDLDELFKGFSENWKSNLEQQSRNNNNNKNEVSNSEDDPQICRQQKTTEEKTKKKKKKKVAVQPEEGKRNELAKKMKEFEMLEGEDVDHLLDIEEVLDSYSRLTSPVYVEMVDEFFMDMYSEFSIPKPSAVTVSRNSSMRRVGSCNSSMRRAGSCNSSMRIVDSCTTSIRRLAPLKL